MTILQRTCHDQVTNYGVLDNFFCKKMQLPCPVLQAASFPVGLLPRTTRLKCQSSIHQREKRNFCVKYFFTVAYRKIGLVPVGLSPRPSRSIDFAGVSKKNDRIRDSKRVIETNDRERPRNQATGNVIRSLASGAEQKHRIGDFRVALSPIMKVRLSEKLALIHMQKNYFFI